MFELRLDYTARELKGLKNTNFFSVGCTISSITILQIFHTFAPIWAKGFSAIPQEHWLSNN